MYRFEAMTPALASEIAWQWRYSPPFDFYDADADPEDFAELLDQAQWPELFEACFEGDTLVGFFSASVEGSEAEIGLGLRPDMTGAGRGSGFVEALLARLRQMRPDLTSVILSVAEFNQRAIRTYRTCGFEITGRHMQETNGGIFPFIDMQLTLDRVLDPL